MDARHEQSLSVAAVWDCVQIGRCSECKGFFALHGTGERGVDDEFGDQVLGFSRYGGRLLCGENGSDNEPAVVRASGLRVMQKGWRMCPKALPGFVKVYARQVPSSGCDLTSKTEICDTAHVFLVEMDWIQVGKKQGVWSVLIGLLPVQPFPPHVLLFSPLASWLFTVSKLLPYSNAPSVCQEMNQLYEVDVKALLALECAVVVLEVMQSTAECPKERLGVVAARKIWKWETIWAYYGSLVYTHLSKQPLPMKQYGEAIRAVSVSTFYQCITAHIKRETDCRGVKHPCWIVAAPILCDGPH